jgi:hypothetical protein
MSDQLTPSEWILRVAETASELGVADDRYSSNDRWWKEADKKAREAELAALAAWEQDAADAARFRWLVEHTSLAEMLDDQLREGFPMVAKGEDIRAAFDRVMAREGGK